MCYICREEERYDGLFFEHFSAQSVDPAVYSSCTGEDQVDTPVSMHSYRSWSVTASLFAFSFGPNMSLFRVLPESCLLHWIQSSQETQTRVDKAFKCPQCGADYEIESDNPPALRFLNKLNKFLTNTGKAATVVGMGTTVFTFGTCAFVSPNLTVRALTLTYRIIGNIGIYLMCTSYGAWAVREFLGQEM